MELHERISSGPKPSQEQEPFAELKNKVHMMVISELGPQLFNVTMDPNVQTFAAKIYNYGGTNKDTLSKLPAELQERVKFPQEQLDRLIKLDLGMMVERRDHVRMTRFSPLEFIASTFLTRWSSTKGPFFSDLDISVTSYQLPVIWCGASR